MNIAEYFESVKDRILADSFVIDFKILKYVDRSNNGHMRARVIFSDDSNLEFSEFIKQSAENEISLVTYSYHWSDKNDTLIRRWDNALHYPNLENFPHHIHTSEMGEAISGKPVNIFEVLDQIGSSLNK